MNIWSLHRNKEANSWLFTKVFYRHETCEAAFKSYCCCSKSHVTFIPSMITAFSPNLRPHPHPSRSHPLFLAGDAVTLWDMDVIWTAVLFAIWERRLPSRFHLLSIILAFVGIILVCQPEIIFKGAHSDAYQGNGSFKKKCQLSWSFVFC